MKRYGSSSSRRTRAGSLLVLAGSLLTLACRETAAPVPPEPVRLLDGAATEVHWPNPERAVPAKFLPAHVGGVAAPGRLARIVLHRGPDERDGRLALLAPTGSRYRFEVQLPAGEPQLELGLGHALEPLTEGTDLRFRVTLTEEDGTFHELLDRTLTTAAGASWSDQAVPLAPWAGHAVSLELLVEGPHDANLWPAWAVPEITVRTPPERYDLLLVVLDTLRADRLGSYGYTKHPTSPFLDRWSSAGTRFATAVSQSSWTRPSHRSLFSGLYPISRQGLTSPPLAEVLWRAGYRTQASTGGAQLAYRFGFSRGFEAHRIERWIHDVDRVVAALDREDRRPLFTFLHTYEIHDPYTHREFAEGLDPGRVGEAFERATLGEYGQDLTPTEREYVNALYDSGIRYVDRQLEILFGHLEAAGRLENTLVVITSDHGEELWDHDHWGHGHTMFEHQTRVPLLVHLPESLRRERGLERAPGLVVEAPVRLVDLYPTLLDLLDVPFDHPVQGRSIVPLFGGRTMPPADALSESIYWGPLEVKSLRDARYKYLRATPKKEHDERPGWEALFDLETDPAERDDQLGHEPERAERMRTLLSILTAEAGEAEATIPEDLDPELEEQLRALGYL